MLAKTAWIIYWQVMGSSPAIKVQENEVVTILSSRMGIEKAMAALELLYKQSSYTLSEQMKWRQVGSGPYKVENNIRIHGVPATGRSYSIGHNPMLTLHKVENLKIADDRISWTEKGVEHPLWLCHDMKHLDCELAGKPAKSWNKSYTLPESEDV